MTVGIECNTEQEKKDALKNEVAPPLVALFWKGLEQKTNEPPLADEIAKRYSQLQSQEDKTLCLL